MPPKKGGKKGKKEKKKVRKFDLDLLGILTFTRIYGHVFEDFMYSDDKGKGKGKGGKKPPAPAKGKGKDKKGKKGKKEVEIPFLMKFPVIPEDRVKIRKFKLKAMKSKEEPDAIVTSMNVGYGEKTTRPELPLVEGGSIRDVICKKYFPLIPRPQPHGGVLGNVKCVLCASKGALLKTTFGLLHKKLRKQMNVQFDKAKALIEWVGEKYKEMISNYLMHMQNLFAEMGPTLDALDESEFDEHMKVRNWKEKWRNLQREANALRKELRRLRKNPEAEIESRLRDKIAEMEEARRQMEALESKVREAQEMLKDWQKNKDNKLTGPRDEVQKLKELLQRIRDSILIERDTLRALLAWEMKMATENTIAKMEEIINSDLDEVQGWMHTAWFRLFLENRRMQEERSRLQVENHLLELEVEALTRQVGQMEANKKEIEGTRTHFITPPSLQAQVDKFTRTGQYPKNLELWDYPPTRFIHE